MKTIMKILVVKRESQIPCAEVQSVGVCVWLCGSAWQRTEMRRKMKEADGICGLCKRMQRTNGQEVVGVRRRSAAARVCEHCLNLAHAKRCIAFNTAKAINSKKRIQPQTIRTAILLHRTLTLARAHILIYKH